MKSFIKAAIITGILAFGATSAMATGGPPTSTPSQNHAKAKAYGKYCQSESRKHVAGTAGTPFSVCVTAMAKLANGAASHPRTACKDESKQHVEGQHGTPFSQCVSAGAKLLRGQNGQSPDA